MVTTKVGLKKGTLIIVIILVTLVQALLTGLNDFYKVPFYRALTIFNVFVSISMFVCFISTYDGKPEYRKLQACIEKNLKIIGATVPFFDNIELLPNIKVNESSIIIDITNINIRKILEKNADVLSSALPKNYIVNDYYLSKDEKKFLINYENINKPTRYIFNSLIELNKTFENFNSYVFPLDKKRSINLKEQPHLLITGASGSGKSYYSMFLVAYCLNKGFDTYILDFKQSYTMFEDTKAVVAFTVDEIAEKIQVVRELLHERQYAMKDYLRMDNNLVACQCGFVPLIVFVEEFTALMNSGADKKVLKDIEATLLEISSIGRTASVHLVLITQVASATNLNTSIRSNLTPLVMGNGSSTIYETALGCKVPDVMAKFEKGEGLAKFDVDIFKFSTPTLNFPLREFVNGQE